MPTIIKIVFYLTAQCTFSCLHGGKCTSPNKCSCPRGYSGSRCQTGKTINVKPNISDLYFFILKQTQIGLFHCLFFIPFLVEQITRLNVS